MTIRKGYFFAIISIIFMSLAGPLQKIGSANSHPLWVTLISCCTAFLMASAFNLYRKNKSALQINQPIIILSILYALAMTAFSFSISMENPFIVSAVGRSYIAFSFLLSLYSLRELQTKRRLISIVIIIIGSFCISLNSEDGTVSLSLGVSLAFLYALLFAIHNAYLKSRSDISVFSILQWQNLITVISILIFLVPDDTNIASPTLLAASCSALSGGISSFLGFLFYHQSLRYLGFAEATSIRAVSPIMAAVVIAPFFPPTITPFLILGFILILIGHYFYFKSEVIYAGPPNRRVLSIFKRKRNPN